MPDNKLEETVASLFSDVISFLEKLNDSKLSKHDLAQKSQLIERISKIKEDFPQLNSVKNRTDSYSSSSQSELYADIETEVLTDKLKKGKSSPDLSASNSSSGERGTEIKGYLIRKSGYEVKVPTGQNKEFVFELVGPGKISYKFAAGSWDELVRWTSVLKSETTKGTAQQSSIGGKNGDDDYDDDENYNDCDFSKFHDDGYIEKRAKISLEPEDDELYDDIAAQETATKATTRRKSSPPPPPSPAAIEDLEEVYDDVAEFNPPPKKAQKNLPELPQTTTRTTAVVAPPSKQRAQTTVSSKDNLPYDKMYYGKWDCTSAAKDELSFTRGDVMTVLSQEFDSFGWWVADLNGTIGLVPRDYLTPAYELITSK